MAAPVSTPPATYWKIIGGRWRRAWRSKSPRASRSRNRKGVACALRFTLVLKLSDVVMPGAAPSCVVAAPSCVVTDMMLLVLGGNRTPWMNASRQLVFPRR